jgi:hypothetical protein
MLGDACGIQATKQDFAIGSDAFLAGIRSEVLGGNNHSDEANVLITNYALKHAGFFKRNVITEKSRKVIFGVSYLFHDILRLISL